MSRAIVLAACAITLCACTTVKFNHDNTNTITHEAGSGVGQELADRACSKAGESKALIVSTVNKDASLPPGTGKQLTTFRCTSEKQ